MTTELRQALSDAQGPTGGNENPYIEPRHLLTALLNQHDGRLDRMDRMDMELTASSAAPAHAA